VGKMAAILAAPARPVLISFGRLVYEVRRVNSDDLRRVGYAVLEGAASVRAAEKEIKEESRKARALLKATPAEELAEQEALAEERLAEISIRRFEALTATPQSQVALLERCGAYICAAVVGAGRLREEVETPDLGVVVAADDPATVLEDLRSDAEIEAGKPPIYVERISYVRLEAEQNIDAGRIWLHALPEDDRSLLGSAIILLQSVSREVTPFRLCPRGAPADRRAGEEVQPAAARDPDARPVPNRASRRSKRGRATS
jgi:hypothetical protein